MADDRTDGSSTPPSLEEFADRLDAARSARRGARGPDGGTGGAGTSASAGLGTGFRIATELVAALVVGIVLGAGFDVVFATSPWGFVCGFFIGVAAGLNNTRRAMNRMNQAAAEAARKDED